MKLPMMHNVKLLTEIGHNGTWNRGFTIMERFRAFSGGTYSLRAGQVETPLVFVLKKYKHVYIILSYCGKTLGRKQCWPEL
jgi:hypothetical protein